MGKSIFRYLSLYFISLIWVSILILIFPEIPSITDYLNYEKMWTSTYEDTGFYPGFIFLREVFIFLSLPFSVFQVFTASLYFFSLFALSLHFTKNFHQYRPLIYISMFLLCFFSYPLFKSYTLVKSFLSFSVFNIALLCYSNGLLRNKVVFLAPLFISPITLPIVLTQFLDLPARLRRQLFAFISNLKVIYTSYALIQKKAIYSFVLSLFFVFFVVTFLLRASLFSSPDYLDIMFLFMVHKFNYYFSPSLVALFVGMVLVFAVIMPSFSVYFLIITLMLLFNYQRTSILLPTFCLLVIINRPSYRPFAAFLLTCYSFYNFYKALAIAPSLL